MEFTFKAIRISQGTRTDSFSCPNLDAVTDGINRIPNVRRAVRQLAYRGKGLALFKAT
jgi:hypothetical protein